MEINIYKNNENIKCITEELQKPVDLTALISAIKKTKETSNAYLTELVEIEKSTSTNDETISDYKNSQKMKRKDNLKGDNEGDEHELGVDATKSKKGKIKIKKQRNLN